MSRHKEAAIEAREAALVEAEFALAAAAEVWLDSRCLKSHDAMVHCEAVLDDALQLTRSAAGKLARTRRRLEKHQAKEARA